MSAATARQPGARPSVAARRAGYVVSVLVNAALLWLLNVRPGWQALPFLTDETAEVVPLVNASLVAAVVANALFVVTDPPWFKALGDLVVAAVGLVAVVALWRTYPFAFGDGGVDWDAVVRVLLVLSVAGSVIGIAVDVVRLVQALGSARARTTDAPPRV